MPYSHILCILIILLLFCTNFSPLRVRSIPQFSTHKPASDAGYWKASSTILSTLAQARQSLAARSGTEETWFGEPVVECVASAGCWRQQDRGPVVLAVSRCNTDVSSRVVSESHLGSLASPTHSICDIYISRVQGCSWSIKSTNAVKIFSLFACQVFLHTLYFLFMCAFTTS